MEMFEKHRLPHDSGKFLTCGTLHELDAKAGRCAEALSGIQHTNSH
jgi:hypothetical protein